jgi:hypothetical protein
MAISCRKQAGPATAAARGAGGPNPRAFAEKEPMDRRTGFAQGPTAHKRTIARPQPDGGEAL